MASHGHPALTDECGGCGAAIEGGNYRVVGGEPHCNECEPLAVGRGLPSPGFEPPQTAEEYEASKNVVIPIAELMDAGDPR